MGSDLLQKLSKKKGACILLLQNTTEFSIQISGASLTKGKVEKSTPFPTSLAPTSAVEVGLYTPEGQWTFALQGDASTKTRLTILHSAQHANLERLPAGASWSADMQQNWKPEVPQLVITFIQTG